MIIRKTDSRVTKCAFLLVLLGWIVKKLTEAETELFFSTPEFISKFGYGAETHTVITEDGYVLNLHRIRPKIHPVKQYPVFLQHGFLASSDIWVLRGPDKDLAFMLADQGYDVWLGNSRGNHYSRGKIKQNETCNINCYANFSWHEMGSYDLPASIDHVLRVTNASQLIYISHSMGNTMHLVMGAMRPKFNEKIKYSVAIGPMMPREQFRTFVHRVMEKLYLWSGPVLKFVDSFDLLSRSTLKSYLMHLLCHSDRPWSFIYNYFMTSVGGPSTCQTSSDVLNLIPSHNPTGMMYHTLHHFYDNILSGQFRMRNFGVLGNLYVYNSTLPPKYDVRHITTPISIYYGACDTIATPMCVRIMTEELPNVVSVKRLLHFNHMDLIWADEATPSIFKSIINEVNKVI